MHSDEGTKWITGASGSNQSIGIETKLAGGASEVNAAGEALAANDVYGLIEALPLRSCPNAAWQMELSTRNFIHRLHSPSGTEPALIEGNEMIGLPYYLNSNIDPYSSVNPAADASNMVLFVGDWSQYVMLDRSACRSTSSRRACSRTRATICLTAGSAGTPTGESVPTR